MNNILTLQALKDMAPDTIFATGVTTDDENGINITSSGEALRWVAVRGGIHDWTIYAHYSSWSEEAIRQNGDKVYSEDHIKKLVPCDDEAFNMYRF